MMRRAPEQYGASPAMSGWRRHVLIRLSLPRAPYAANHQGLPDGACHIIQRIVNPRFLS